MSGHSKWSNIKRTKGAKDAKRGALFTKLSRDITLAVRLGGGGDPATNSMLKAASDRAKLANMTNDKIQKAVDKGLGIGKESTLVHEKTYEAYGPARVPLLIDSSTDNPNRALAEIKLILNKGGGRLLNEGAISWQFKEVGIIKLVISKTTNLENAMLELFDIDGINDITTEKKETSDQIVIETRKDHLRKVYEAIQLKVRDSEPKEAMLVKMYIGPKISPTEEEIGKLAALVDNLESSNEIENVWVGLN